MVLDYILVPKHLHNFIAHIHLEVVFVLENFMPECNPMLRSQVVVCC